MNLYIPRCKVQAYKHAEGANLRVKKNNLRFTKGTDPRVKDIMTFLVDDSIGCPQFLPLDREDAIVTNTIIEAATYQSEIPLSEFIRKENYFKFF